MGKYMRKAKIRGDVAVMEFSQSSLGVRTRAKTLALQRLQATPPQPPPPNPESSYLELRSRRLEKPPLIADAKKQQQSTAKDSCGRNADSCRNPNPRASSRLRLSSSNSGSAAGSVSIRCCSKKEEGCFGETTVWANKDDETIYNYDLGIDASFGENNLDFEGRDRSTRESTPCSLIRSSDNIVTPGSSTRPTSLSAVNRRIRNSQRNIPTSHELEEFFACAEQQQQRLFTERYNFDVASDMPLPGRYEWVRLYP